MNNELIRTLLLNPKLRLILVLAFVTVGCVACNPFPYRSECLKPSFVASKQIQVSEYFDEWGYFEDYCPHELPKEFTYSIDEHVSVGIRVGRGELYLSPTENGQPTEILAAPGGMVRKINTEGYTQMIILSEQKDQSLSFRIPGRGVTRLDFDLVKCTCVSFDAI